GGGLGGVVRARRAALRGLEIHLQDLRVAERPLVERRTDGGLLRRRTAVSPCPWPPARPPTHRRTAPPTRRSPRPPGRTRRTSPRNTARCSAGSMPRRPRRACPPRPPPAPSVTPRPPPARRPHRPKPRRTAGS